MRGQMQRMTSLQIANHLAKAADAAQTQLAEIAFCYTMARDAFTGATDDVDPSSMAYGVQASALGCICIARWLKEASQVTDKQYSIKAKLLAAYVDEELTRVGVVLPDTMLL